MSDWCDSATVNLRIVWILFSDLCKWPAMARVVVSALYKFVSFEDTVSLRETLQEACTVNGIKGSLLLASEGINGTIAGSAEGIETILRVIKSLPGCADLEHKESWAEDMPFLRMKVRLKKEIVTMGQPLADPGRTVGTYVTPEDWNDLISRDDVVVIDTRNDYEVGIGTFEGAVDPETASFREFPEWWARHHNEYAGKKIAMFCTGGIRCEKSTSYLKSLGHEDVFHLKGGILKYLETVPQAESRWNGECFVFDNRVSVGHGLELGSYELCYACRRPITQDDKASQDFEIGVSCPQCIDELTEAQRDGFRERQKQVAIAESRGMKHIGEKDETQIHKSKFKPILD